jgi:hypothetical protein
MKMKTFRNLLIAFLMPVTALMFSSCAEDVVSIDLNSSAPKIVIEGKVVEGNGPQTVKITKTTDFFKPSEYPPVSGAVVKIADNKGNTETLSEKEPGVYTTSALEGVPGRTYTLTVDDNNKVYSAVSTMPSPSHLDSLSFEIKKEFEDQYILHAYYTDKKDMREYLRLKIYVNGKIQNDYYMYQDRLTDGKNLDFEFYLDDPVYNGDIIVTEGQTIDKPVYEYFNTLQDALINISGDSGGPFSSTPGNPTSNISNRALGYFSAFSSVTDTLIYIKK